MYGLCLNLWKYRNWYQLSSRSSNGWLGQAQQKNWLLQELFCVIKQLKQGLNKKK